MEIRLDWLGTATFRLTLGETVVMLDAYVDRIDTAPPTGVRAADIDRADFILVGHSHFDHLAGAEVIAANTGARIIGSNESCRVMRERGIGDEQLLPSQGGERHRISDDVTVRIYPSVHTCLWAPSAADASSPITGGLGLCEDERAALFAAGNDFTRAYAEHPGWAPKFIDHVRTSAGSRRDGGPLVYLFDTPAGRIFWQDSCGCWTGILRGVETDVAILAVAGRPNCDGEPWQDTMADFIAMEAELLGARTVILGHHDNWLGIPGARAYDTSPIRDALERAGRAMLEPGYREGTRLLA